MICLFFFCSVLLEQNERTIKADIVEINHVDDGNLLSVLTVCVDETEAALGSGAVKVLFGLDASSFATQTEVSEPLLEGLSHRVVSKTHVDSTVITLTGKGLCNVPIALTLYEDPKLMMAKRKAKLGKEARRIRRRRPVEVLRQAPNRIRVVRVEQKMGRLLCQWINGFGLSQCA